MVTFAHVEVRSARRLRLEFSSALAAGAFVPSWYAVVCEDSTTGDPGVNAAIVVPALGNRVELALDRDLGQGAQYTLHIAAGVPALDASTLVAPVVQYFYPPSKPQAPSESVSANDLLETIFQIDIAHDPTTGHQWDPNGDLATLTGPENVTAAGKRGLVSEGLPHRRGWGAALREFVDAPEAMLPTLRGRIERQLTRDDRVTAARGRMQLGADGDHYASGELELIGQVKTNFKERVSARR